MRLAITGVTSGVGLRLAEVAIDRGHAVTGLVRSPDREDARALAARGARLVPGDLESGQALKQLCNDADAVVHLAAHVGDKGTAEQFDRVNVAGTRNTIDAAAAARAGIFVHLSSTAVYGRPDRGRVTEAWPTRKSGLPYEDTKTEAERLAFSRGRMYGLPVIALRPPIIYGPHDRNFMPRFVDRLRKGSFLFIDGGRAPLNVVSVDHVVDAILLAAARPDLGGEAFNVMDEVSQRPPSVREVVEIIAREAGLPAPTRSIPFPLAMAAARLFELGGSLRAPKNGAPRELPLTRSTVKILTRDVIYDASKAVELLGWSPRTSARDGLARAAQAFAPR